MNNQYTAIIKQEKDWWIGWIEEVPGVNCQEKSREQLLVSLRETLQEALEFNRKEAIWVFWIKSINLMITRQKTLNDFNKLDILPEDAALSFGRNAAYK